VESIEQTPDGGYIVAGFTDPIGLLRSDIWILKLQPNGTVEWQRTYGGWRDDSAFPMTLSSEGGVVVAGRTSSFGTSSTDLWLLKLDPGGNVEWQKAYRGSDSKWPRAIQQTHDGGYVVAGYLASLGAAVGDLWVLKVGPSGNVEWQKTYGAEGDEYGFALQQTIDEGYIVAGYAASGAMGKDFWVLKLHVDGTIEWQKTYGGSADEEARSAQQTSDGGYVVAGSTESFGAGRTDLWILKLEPSGNIQWQKTYGGSGEERRTRTIQQTADGGYIVAVGETNSFRTGFDAWLLKLDQGGGVEWQKTYGRSVYDEAESLRQTTDGGYVICGNTARVGSGRDDGGGRDDFWIWKINADGTILPSCELVRNTNVSGVDSAAAARTSSMTATDTAVIAGNTAATVRDTRRLPNFLCAAEIWNGVDNTEMGLSTPGTPAAPTTLPVCRTW
jgi:hypothetical protein